STCQHDVTQVFIEHQLGDLGGVRRGGDARPQRVAALGAAVERRRVDDMPSRSKAGRRRLPDPTALISSVDQYKYRHSSPLFADFHAGEILEYLDDRRAVHFLIPG